jgi:hypothetical protein
MQCWRTDRRDKDERGPDLRARVEDKIKKSKYASDVPSISYHYFSARCVRWH